MSTAWIAGMAVGACIVLIAWLVGRAISRNGR